LADGTFDGTAFHRPIRNDHQKLWQPEYVDRRTWSAIPGRTRGVNKAVTMGREFGESRDQVRAMRPSIRKTLVVIHVIVSVALAGEVWGLVVLNVAATLTKEPGLAGAAYRLMPYLVFAGGIPLSLTALASGVVLGLTSHWRLFRYYWTAIKLGLLVAVVCVGMFLFDPAGMAAAVARSSPARRPWGQEAALGAEIVMLIAATGLSVFLQLAETAGEPALRVGL